jgi:HK97 family phage major capsid protein
LQQFEVKKINLKSMRKRIMGIKEQMAAIIAAAEENGGIMTAEQRAEFEKLEAQYEAQKQLEAKKTKLAEIEARETESAGRVVEEKRAPVVTGGRDRIEDDPKRGFRNLAEFALSVRSSILNGGTTDQRLRVMGAPTDPLKAYGDDGGYLVPPGMADEVWTGVWSAENEVTAFLNQIPTQSTTVTLPKVEATPWGSTGVRAYWQAESGQMTATKPNVSGKHIQVQNLYAFVEASDQLLEDAPRLNALLTTESAKAISWKLGDAAVNGDGVGKPVGWFGSGAQVSVAKEGSQTADTINATNVAKMYARMLPSGLGSSFWVVNPDAMPQLLTMTLGNQAIYVPPSGFQGAPGGFLLGRPVVYSEHAQTVGDQGDIQFCSAAGYYLAVRQSAPMFAQSMHLFFDYGTQAFRWTFRAGGAPVLSAPISPANGSNTKSHFVVLDARA